MSRNSIEADAIRLVRLAAPIAVSRSGLIAMGVVDMIVVGQFAPSELAHQALGWTLNGPALLGGIGLLLGVQVLTARAAGAGRLEAAGPIWRRGLVVAFAVGALLCAFTRVSTAPLLQTFGVATDLAVRGGAVAGVLALSVPFHLAFMASTKLMEALERPGPAVIVMWLGNGVNLILNLWFVPEAGAVGSAWATVLSRLFLALALPAVMLSTPALRRVVAGRAADRAAGYRPLLGIGTPAAVGALIEAGAFAAMSVIAARAGGPIAVATWTIATGGLVTLAYLLAQGLATSAVVLVSEALGAGQRLRARRIGWMAIGLTLMAMAVCGGLCIAFAQDVAAAFSADSATATALAAAMPLIGLLMLPDGGQGAVDAVLRANGVNWTPTAFRFAAFVGAAPVLAVWLAEPGPGAVSGVLIATIAAGGVAFIAMMARLASVPRT